MLCRKPYIGHHGVYGCGQCLPCRYNRRRLWTHRILLESFVHEASSFLTLTYDAKHLPSGGTLVPRDVQLWLKRFRLEIAPLKLRYYLVGEYGDHSQRPHYHAALFGVGRDYQSVVERTWAKGHVMLGDLTHHSAQYIAGYVTKKMTMKDDPRLNGRFPEFARMSNRPGIGALALVDVKNVLTTIPGMNQLEIDGDVPKSLKHGSRSMPLGRYLRRKLREALGCLPDTPTEIVQKFAKEMYDLREAYLADASCQGLSFSQALANLHSQSALNMEVRDQIYQSSKRSL